MFANDGADKNKVLEIEISKKNYEFVNAGILTYKCPNCGEECIGHNDKYCSHCGAKITWKV